LDLSQGVHTPGFDEASAHVQNPSHQIKGDNTLIIDVVSRIQALSWALQAIPEFGSF